MHDDRTRSQKQPRGLTVPQALDACLTVHGTLASKTELRQFMQANSVAMIDGRHQRYGVAELSELRRRRAARGLTTPKSKPPLKDRPDYAIPVDISVLPPELRPPARSRHTARSSLEWFHRFADGLHPDLTPVAYLYAEYARRTPGAPGSERLAGRSFQQTQDLVIAERVARRRTEPGAASGG